MILVIEYKKSNDQTKYFIYDDEIYSDEKEIEYLMNVTDMGAIYEGCANLDESEYNLIKKAFNQKLKEMEGNNI